MKSVVYQEVLADLNDLETALTAIDDRRLFEADSILIYLNGPQWISASKGGLFLKDVIAVARRQARERLTGQALYFAPDPASLCGRDGRLPKAGDFRPLQLNYRVSEGAAFEALSDADLASLMAQATSAAIEGGLPRCIVTAPSGQHFELPSKSHASHFIRLSEAFDCIEAVQRVAYWVVVSMIQALAEDDVLPDRAFLVDHPTMLLLGTHVNLIYGGTHQVLTLKGYPSESSLRTQTSKLLRMMGAKGVQVTAVIGIASTGKLAKILKELAVASQASLDVCLVFAPLDIQDGPRPMTRLEIQGYSHAVDAASCQVCRPENPAPIQIHSQSFLLSFAAPVEIPLKPAYFELQRSFIDKYGAVPGALRVHFDDPNEVYPRHHAFGIDATVLLKNSGFLQEVISKLASLDPRPDFVVIPEHKSSTLLRSTISQWDPVPVVTWAELEGLKNKIPHKPTVLVFDDKVVSGKRLRDINVRLRDPRPLLWDTFTHVHFFAPVVTTKSKKQLVDLQKGLTTKIPWGASLHYLYCVHLPHWHTTADCPWCNERRMLEQLASEADAFDSALTNRLVNLDSREPLDCMGCLASTPGEPEFPALATGSLAASTGASQLQVLMTTASAVQQLRTDPVKPLDPHSLTLPTKMSRFVVEDAFTEKLIACSILRSLAPAEVSTEMAEYLVTALKNPGTYQGTHLYQIELAIALIAGKMGTVKEISTAWGVLLKYGVSADSLHKLGFCEKLIA